MGGKYFEKENVLRRMISVVKGERSAVKLKESVFMKGNISVLKGERSAVKEREKLGGEEKTCKKGGEG